MTFKEAFQFHMNGFLTQSGFISSELTKDCAEYLYVMDKRKMLSFCLHKSPDSDFMDAEAEIKDGELILGTVDLIRFFNETEYSYGIPLHSWYWDSEEELLGVIAKQKRIIKNFIVPIFSGEMEFDFNEHREEEKRRTNEIRNSQYDGDWYKYTLNYLQPLQGEWARKRFK